MALPILETAKYTLTLPSTKKKIEYRPFLVKEEKILLLAQQSGKTEQMFSAMREIVDACTFQKLDIPNLCIFDLEFIFLKLRAKSVGEIVELEFKCKECEAQNPVSINIDTVSVKYPRKKADSKIQLTDQIGVICTYPKVKSMHLMQSGDPFDMISTALESIYDSEQVYSVSDESPEEIQRFIESLSHKQIEKITEYLLTAPSVSHKVKFDCNSCSKKNEVVVEGTESFFG